ncbi:MAG: DUF1194 domain-containing protein [Neomegalonema sp.]|nr:DUF1194 domain-containing protein [Neomegalonema sp.]
MQRFARLFPVALAALALLLAPAARAQTRVDIELVLLSDASGSIDTGEIRLQRQGYAKAFRDPKVVAAMTAGYYRKIAVAYVEWADAHSQDVVVDWMVIDGPKSAAAFADKLMAAPRRAYGYNAIGAALLKAVAMIKGNRFAGERRVIDFSGDSVNNWEGPSIATGRAAALKAGVTINGLAVLCRICSGRPGGYDLEEAYKTQIIGGPGAFVITADSLATFAEAVKRKLLRELLSEAGPTPRL